MSIVRAPREGNFTIIPNSTLRDTSLSYRARGVLAYVLSHPDNWVTSAQRLADEGTEGRDAMRKALAELETAGYLVRRRFRGDDGRWQTDQVLHDTPQGTDEASTDETEPGRETSAGNPALESRSYKETQQQDEKIAETSFTASPSSDVSEEASEEKPKQSTQGALIVAKHWTKPTTQSKAAIALAVSKALADGFPEQQVIAAIRLLADNECYVSAYSFGQAMHGKVVNGPNAGKKGPMAADQTGQDYTSGGTYHDEGDHKYWTVEL